MIALGRVAERLGERQLQCCEGFTETSKSILVERFIRGQSVEEIAQSWYPNNDNAKKDTRTILRRATLDLIARFDGSVDFPDYAGMLGRAAPIDNAESAGSESELGGAPETDPRVEVGESGPTPSIGARVEVESGTAGGGPNRS